MGGDNTLDYVLHSRGSYCSNNGLPFLMEGDFGTEECLQRCHDLPNCFYFTIYSNMWCQMSSRCHLQGEAGDPSAATYIKTHRVDTCLGHSPKADCFGEWLGDDVLGKSIRPRR